MTHLILASCTGFIAPGLDQILAQKLGLRPDLQRLLVGFMGCCAAVPALRAAQAIVLAHPAARVLVVNVELCTLHLQETTDLEVALSFLLFGDGATAALVTAEPEGLRLGDFVSVAIPDTADHITWHIGDQGFLMHLSGQVPGAILRALRESPQAVLRGQAAISTIGASTTKPAALRRRRYGKNLLVDLIISRSDLWLLRRRTASCGLPVAEAARAPEAKARSSRRSS